MFGTATVNGVVSATYRIDLRLAAWQRGEDTYRIRLDNGYDSGAQQIRYGVVDIHNRFSERRRHVR